MQPLRDLLVLDLSQNLAGPFCAQVLADMGAEVIKVERPGSGDAARSWGPPFWGGDGTIFLAANRNKRSLALDLKRPAGRGVLLRLVERADVLVQSLRAGVAESLGLDYGAVRAVNPRLVYCSVTAYGERGPRSGLPGYDPLLQAYGGLMSINGHPGQPPSRVGTSMVDIGTGLWGALGILGALRERERTGEGSHVVTSLYDTTLSWVGYHLLGYLASGTAPGPQGAGLGMIAPYEAFPTADGQLMIAAANDGLFRRCCAALGLEGVAADPRFRDNPSRVRHRAELFERLAAATRGETTRALEARLCAAGVPCAPIQTMDQVARDPQTDAAGVLQRAPHPMIEDYRTVAPAFEWNGERPGVRRLPPRLGEHTEEILREIGLSDEAIAALEGEGVIER